MSSPETEISHSPERSFGLTESTYLKGERDGEADETRRVIAGQGPHNAGQRDI